MMRIGLIGEAPNDTDAVANLLSKRYADYIFFPLLNNINGSQLDNQKTKRLLRIEFEVESPDKVIFIRDLDAILPDNEKLKERREYFSDFNSVVDKTGIFLLNIYELETLILADIETFNRLYDTNHQIDGDVMTIPESKEVLKHFSKKFNESENPEVFKELDINIVIKNCKYFRLFINKFDKAIQD